MQGDINLLGEQGHYGTWIDLSGNSFGLSGEGGNSSMGHGGRRVIHPNFSSGEGGSGYGGGGSGAVAGAAAMTGGSGASGVLIVKEFF